MSDAQSIVNDFLAAVDTYINGVHSCFSSYNEDFLEAASLTFEDIDKCSRAELMNYSFILQQYSSYIQDELNKNVIVLNWTENIINDLLVKYEKDHGSFDKYTKYELKRSILFSDNSFAEKINEIRQTAQSRVTVLEGKVGTLKRMSDILLERSKA